ncbi:Oidioi.mRNA.OKI2018_I69.chr2.g5749.t1.cds [Oikopleura dioica]|uniref:tRNA wybutosine-synthesizing protein 3 homolog n=1 Tax=Oikopleura dioica TaxID=34765 RepID=A0ABN7T7U5_OIKDI|nr:Oidioi.mRNA.OKI2018_I69.chr2.g5749.t1.cds [Oikopleura dioica]
MKKDKTTDKKVFAVEVKEKEFLQRKKTVLGKADLSRSIDEAMIPLVEYLNSKDETFTTSCCSGRVSIVSQAGFTDTVKEGCPWIFMSHEIIVDVDNVINIVSKGIDENEENQVIIIKFEGAIAHFIVRTLSLGKKLLDAVRFVGFRDSGLAIGANGKFTVQIRGSNSLEVPISRGKDKLVTDEYLRFLLNACNEKMEKNFKMIERLHKAIEAVLEAEG